MKIYQEKLLKRIYAKVDTDEETLCFLYNGGTNGKQYGRMYAYGKMHGVHRVMFAIFFGPIPADREIHHICGVRNCSLYRTKLKTSDTVDKCGLWSL